jgi:signal transduction histidine kinase
MMRDVNRIESIIENVAAFAKDRTVAFSWIRLDEVARGACELVRPSIASSQVQIRLELARESLVYGNSNQLTQVVVNLLDNAVQSYRDGQSGSVEVRVQKREQPGASPTMELSVADDGPGIPPEVLPVMFEPFATTKATGDRTRKEGMGLGLAIVKHIVNGHNGVIRVDSTPGRGTTITVAIPCESTET